MKGGACALWCSLLPARSLARGHVYPLPLDAQAIGKGGISLSNLLQGPSSVHVKRG